MTLEALTVYALFMSRARVSALDTHSSSRSPATFATPTGGHLGGSYPTPPHGLHRRMRHAVNTNPFAGPNVRNAVMAYCEQVGTKRHEGGVNGEICVR